MKKLAFLFLLICSFSTFCQQETDSLVPAQVLFKKDLYHTFSISPNGKLFACVWKNNRENNLLIIDIDEYVVKHTLPLRGSIVNSIYWLSDERLLYESLGNINAINIDGTNASTIISRMNDNFRFSYRGFRDGLRINSVIDFLPKNKNEILIESFDMKGYSSLNRVNIFTGNKIEVISGKYHKINKWFVDSNSKAKIGVRHEDDGFNYLIYNEENDKWEQLYLNINGTKVPLLVKANSYLDQNLSFEGFGYDENKFFLSSNIESDKRKLLEYDLKSQRVTNTLLENKNCDLSDPHGLGSFLIFDGSQRKLAGVRYEGLLPTYHWFSEKFKNIHDSINAKYPHFINDIIDYDAKKNRFVIYQWSDTNKGNVGVFDIKKQQYDVMFHFNEELNKYKLSKTRSFIAKSRDNYSIPCYLNLPKGHKKDAKTPLIVFPHGGPWARDYWEFNQEVQYFTSRGFAVLRVNFRGSTGFGREHVLAGVDNLDKVMINDIADAANYTLKKFALDKNQTTIYGHSYGGYATYLSLAKYPELYKSGVAIAAPSDIKAIMKLLKKDKNYFSYEFWIKALGSKKKKYLASISPINFANEISNPILIFHGKKDEIIPVNQSESMAEALKKTNQNVTYEMLNREGHGIEDSNTLTYVLEKVVNFFKE
jgi:pimeloyl-ACP methyl ester carboxylesterase